MSTGQTIKEELIQEQILQAAGQLFHKYGLHKVTMDDVAKAIGKGRSSLYYYYKSKEEILAAVMGHELDSMLDEVARAVDQASSVEEKIYAFCVTKLKGAHRWKTLYSTLETDMDADTLSAFKTAKQDFRDRFRERQRVLVRQILLDGIAQGELREQNEQELDMQASVLLTSIAGFKQELIATGNLNLAELAVRTLSLVWAQGLKK
jgi:AcrR family transcriptional regulator